MPWWRAPSRRGRRRAAIVLPAERASRAVVADAIGLADGLVAMGLEARIFAGPGAAIPGAEPIGALRDFAVPDGLLVAYRAATGTREDEPRTLGIPGRRIVRDLGAGLHGSSGAGGASEPRAIPGWSALARYLTVSPRAARALARAGVEIAQIAVVPAFGHAAALADVVPDELALHRWSAAGPCALLVAPLTPGQGHRRALRLARAYRELYGETLHLRFAGSAEAESLEWLDVLACEQSRLGLGVTVELTGALSPSELKAAYLTAHLVLDSSGDPGAGWYVAEAFRIGVPVLAIVAEADAEAEADGEGGLCVVDRSDDFVAAAIRRILVDAELRDAILARQRRAFDARLSPASAAKALATALAPLGVGSAVAE